MKASDKFTAKGHLTLRVFKDGNLIETIEGENLIVDLGRHAIAEALAGVPSKQIVEYGAGTDGTAPTVSDTGLTSPFTKAIDTATTPTNGKAVFTFTMSTAEGNGVAYEEWGLFCDDGTMFSRKTTVPIYKDVGMSITGEWSIQIPS